MAKGIVEQLLSRASGEPTGEPKVNVDVEAAKAAVARLRKAMAGGDDQAGADAISDLIKLAG